MKKEGQGGERRLVEDRRRNHAKAFFVQFYKPRRRSSGRRPEDGHGTYVDFHEPQVLLVVVITLALCVVDVYATLTLLQMGGVELNPVMRELIEHDVWTFFIFKYVLTAACLFVLISYKKFRLYKSFSTLHTLYAVLVVYVLLVIYEMKLLAIAAG